MGERINSAIEPNTGSETRLRPSASTRVQSLKLMIVDRFGLCL